MLRKDLSRTYVCCSKNVKVLEVDVNEMIRREPSVDLTDMQVEFSCQQAAAWSIIKRQKAWDKLFG